MSGEERSDAGTDAAGATGEADGVRLTEYAELHGCSCKVGQSDLADLLAAAGLRDGAAEDRGAGTESPHDDILAGVGEDAAARRLTDDLALVQTIDFFTPIVDDPYDFGRVAACNACSDAFATGAVDDLSLLVVLGVPRDLTDHAPAVLAGVRDLLAAVDGHVAGGHTTLNPWPLAGGAVTATAPPGDLLRSSGAQPGDRLVLTKPLGTQPAMGASRVRDGEFAATVAEATTHPVDEIAAVALDWMTTPNDAAARAARGVATAGTDVTGFGLRGQARILAERSGVGVELTALPVIDGTLELSQLFGYGLAEGASAETSGGLLLSVAEDRLSELAARLDERGVFHRTVGRVVAGEGTSLVDPTVEGIPLSS